MRASRTQWSPTLLGPCAFFLWTVVLGCADAPLSNTALVRIGLGDFAAADVESIAIIVRNETQIVASATLTAGRTEVALGVPAEVPLDFFAIARTSLPGSKSAPKMPGYVGSVRTVIPLSSVETRVPIVVRPAGLLTLVEAPQNVRARRRTTPVRILFSDVDAIDVPTSVVIPEETIAWSTSIALPAGRHRVRVAEDWAEDFELAITDGLFVETKRESFFVFALRHKWRVSSTKPQRLGGVVVANGEDQGDTLRLRGAASQTPFAMRVVAFDGRGREVEVPDARVRWSMTATPAGHVQSARGLAGEGVGVPFEIRDLSARGLFRAAYLVTVEFDDGRELSATLRMHAIPSNAVPGPPHHVALDVLNEPNIATGTTLGIVVVDAAGAIATTATAAVDLSSTDAAVHFPDGPSVQLRAEDRGRVEWPIATPTRMVGDVVVIRGTATSTSFSSTATVVLRPFGPS